MLLSMPAVAGAFLALLGQTWIRSSRREGAWVFRYGAAWYLGGTLVQLGVGAWLLLSHPRGVFLGVMGGDLAATGAFVASLALTLLAMGLYGAALGKPRAWGPVWAGALCVYGTVLSMTAVRMHLRDLELAPYLEGLWDVHPQWGFLAIFFGVFALGLGTVGWMLWKVSRPRGEAWVPGSPGPGPR
jgi:hypothetical protein